MAKINSKQKGKRGELELVKELKYYGFETRRSQQYCGTEGTSDITGLKGIHAEVKRVEKLNIHDAIAQAKRDTQGDLPAVFHRRNNTEWLVTMRLEDWVEIYKESL